VCCLGYNNEKFIEDNIRSIWEGDYKQVEIIAVDDGSKDESVELLEALAKQSPYPMKVIAQAHTGKIGMNFNTALKKARGEYVIFSCLDDYLYPDAISKKIKLMAADNSIGFIANGSITIIDAKGKFLQTMVRLKEGQEYSIEDLIELEYKTGSFFIPACVIRTEIVNTIGGYDEDMTGDDIVLKTKLFRYLSNHKEYAFLIFNEPSCYYRMHNSNIHKNISRQIRIISEYLARFWPDRDLPSEYVQWAKYMIRLCPFEEYMKEITYNSVSVRLLNNNDIIKAIKSSFRFPFRWRINRVLLYVINLKCFNWLKWIYHIFKKNRIT
jgi:alpha-1,3-rhamnosyltransferase